MLAHAACVLAEFRVHRVQKSSQRPRQDSFYTRIFFSVKVFFSARVSSFFSFFFTEQDKKEYFADHRSQTA